MSILIVEVVPQGIIFGADRNITFVGEVTKETKQIGDLTLLIRKELISGQSQRPKVLRWPKGKALIGFAGEAIIGGQPADKWLLDFIDNHLEFSTFGELAESLRAEVESQRFIDEGDGDAQALIIHLGGFEHRDGISVPVIWLVTNSYSIDSSGYKCTKHFGRKEEFWKYFLHTRPQHIRNVLADLASRYEPFGFQQGIDLMTFNMLSSTLKGAFRILCEEHPKHTFPKTLADWERQVCMSVLTYGAYFQAYKNPGEQAVGGGADTVSIPWPE